MIKVVLFHIDLTLTLAMVTENGYQKGQTVIFGPEIKGLIDKLVNF